MEVGSFEAEAVFESLNVNPQLFINETLNTVDDFIHDAFDFYYTEASTHMKIQGTDRSQHLSKGVSYIHKKLQSVLDKRLAMWETYCLQRCFAVPQPLSLPLQNNDDSSSHGSICQDSLSDPDLDSQLASLREKLNAVGKESAQLNRELQSLERQYASTNRSAQLLKQVLQMYEQNSAHDMFQELVRNVSELRAAMDKRRNKRMEDAHNDRKEKIYNPHKEFTMKCGKGLSNIKFEDLQAFLADLKNT